MLGNVAHGKHASLLQPSGLAGSDLPEIRQRLVLPEQELIGVLVQFRYPDAVFVGRLLLGHNVHRHLGQIQIGSDPDRCRDAGSFQNFPDHSDCHEVRWVGALALGFFAVGMQVSSTVYEALIDGVHVHVLRGHIVEIDSVDLC